MRTHGKSRTSFAIACLCVLGLVAALGSSAPSAGAAASFPGQGFLPDDRAWEMVSPPAKQGGNVARVSYETHAAADGDAATFLSTVGFGDVRGTTASVEYMARRDGAPGTNGWSTHAITPTQKPLSFEQAAFTKTVLGYQGEFSEDLSQAVFHSYRPLTEDASAAFAPNLYLRSDLAAPGPGSYRLLTDSLAPASSWPPFFLLNFGEPFLAGASADFSHVAFETQLGLTHEPTEAEPTAPLSPGAPKLYENAGGTVRVVGRIPIEPATSCDDAGGPATECVQAESSQAGLSAGDSSYYAARMISADGSRILFQAPAGGEGGGEGKIYMREDGTRTFQLNASEKEPPEPSPQPAKLWDASRDGSRAFFTTSEGLVEGDEDGGIPDLYMYDATKPEGERLTLLSVGAEEAAGVKVIGASDDGHYVYFISDGQLVAGGPTPVARGLYLWHDGEISYIGRFKNNNEAELNTPRTVSSAFTFSKTSRVTPDGRHLLFVSQSDKGFKGIGGFGGYDHGSDTACLYSGFSSCRELYTYNADTAQLRCASCNPSGAAATADALTDVNADGGPITTGTHLSQAISDDGRYVFFSSAERLLPEDTNGASDAYLYDTQSEEPHLLSSGQDKSPSYFLDASADGHDAFFATAEQLSGWDTDTSYDLYDARVGGGLPEPQPAPPSCQGDACQPTPTRLNDPTPASSSFKGVGSPSKGRCPRGKRKVKARNGKSRCVPRKAKKNPRKHRRDAKNNRRAGR